MIGFYRCAFIGDSVIALHALYALHTLYPDEPISIYTNTQGMQIFQPFATWLLGRALGNANITCIDTSTMSEPELLAHINAQSFRVFILTQPNRARCKLLQASNAKRIITLATLWNLPRPRFEKLYFSRLFSHLSYQQALLKLVRMIDKPRYDRARLDFSGLEFPIDMAARERVLRALHLALESSSAHVAMDCAPIDSPQMNSLASNSCLLNAPRSDCAADDLPALPPIICLNPFARSSQINLPLHAHITLAHNLARDYPTTLILLLHHKGAPTITLDSALDSGLSSLESSLKSHSPESSSTESSPLDSGELAPAYAPPPPNLKIFHNDENLAHLIELLRLSSLLISPSTGPIHIANMLRMPIIGIYNRKDARLWLGDSMKRENLLLLETPMNRMGEQQIAHALESITALCKHLLHERGIAQAHSKAPTRASITP